MWLHPNVPAVLLMTDGILASSNSSSSLRNGRVEK